MTTRLDGLGCAIASALRTGLCHGGKILAADLPEAVRASHVATPSAMRRQLDDTERKAIQAALAAERGNQTRAARRLGISRRNLAKYDLRERTFHDLRRQR